LRKQLDAAAERERELSASTEAVEQEKSAAQQQLDQVSQREKELSGALDDLRGKCEQLEQELAQQPKNGAQAKRLKKLQAEQVQLQTQLAEAEQRLAASEQQLAEAARDKGEEEADEECKRRLEMALEDLRETKARNAELQKQLATAQSRPSGATAAAPGALDWEAEKLRVLATLEDDFDDGDEHHEERLKIEEVIGKTDRVLAAKDRVVAEKEQEIEELTRLLQDQSGSVGSMAVGAAALGEKLDSDEIIQQERENLKQLQEQQRDKLRQAEVELSVERANLSRQRAELEDKSQAMQRQGDKSPSAEESDRHKKPARGRWLARLGLKEPDDET
jgi:hypothetical protein